MMPTRLTQQQIRARFKTFFAAALLTTMGHLGEADAQNLITLPTRPCPAGHIPNPGLQPSFSLKRTTFGRDAAGVAHVQIYSRMDTSPDGVYPWNFLKKVDFIPEKGLIGQSITITADPTVGSNLGTVPAPLRAGVYIVVVLVEDAADIADCDSYFAYSIGSITVTQ